LKLPYVLAVAAYCSLIFYLSHQPRLRLPDVPIPESDKVAHAIGYGGLAAIVAVGLRRSNAEISPWLLFLAPLVFAALYGVTDEIHQRFVPNRNFDVLDMAANAAGALLVQIFLCRYYWRVLA
jgi:VanZ family protein